MCLEEGEAGTPRGIRTPDLHLERVMSWAARRWGHNNLYTAIMHINSQRVNARQAPRCAQYGQNHYRRALCAS